MPIARMRTSITLLSATLMVLILALLFWLGQAPQGLTALDHTNHQLAPGTPGDNTFYLGLIPERDIFAQRRRYESLARYLSDALDRPVTLITSNTYHGALRDMAQKRIDGAFMGSMVATLAQDQLQARVLVKPETADGVTTYRGVIFVHDDSPIMQLEDLAGRSIAVVKTTTAGHLFPMYALAEHGLLVGENPVAMRWVGTHDRAIQEVFEGRVDAGAAKDLRIDAFEKAHQRYPFRRLSVSEAVPNNALIVRNDLDETLARELRQVLLGMDKQEAGRATLAVFGASGFVPCDAKEYQAVYDMTERLGPGWGKVESPNAPAIPADRTHLDATHPGGVTQPGADPTNPVPDTTTMGP